MSSGIRPNLNGLTVGNVHSVASPSGPLKLTNITNARSNYSGQTYSPRAIQEMIVRESIKAGVNPRVMLMKVDIETGGTFDPWSRNSKTNASGLSQIMPANFGKYRLNGSNVFDPVSNIKAGIAHHQADVNYFRSKMGRNPTDSETYLLHQQGMAGATALLRKPTMLASEALKPFYKPGVNVKAVTQNGGRAHWTSAQFTSMWINQANKRLNKF